MTAKPQLHTAEVDPRTHQGPAAFFRDLLETAARMDFHRPAGVPAYTTHDLQDCGVEAAMDGLLTEDDVSALHRQLATLTAEFVDFRTRATDNFVRHAEKAKEDRARIRNLESLVQEREKETEALRVRMVDAERRLDDIVRHNDRIANVTTPLVLGVDQLTDLVRHAPKLLKLAGGHDA